ncbi:hypothetical protein AltI4_33140 [Alteromonas sp. I4]|nr:hypothetical protein AltI4_33140 [Alteromonas sp. I4]
MTSLTVHTLDSAPEASKPLLEDSIKAFGMLPNLHGIMAASPQVLEGYKVLHDLFQKTDFTAEELTVVWQTINVEHGCHYCVPAHTAIAHSMNVDAALTEALRNAEPMPTPKLQALQDMTLLLTRNRGVVSDADLDAFYSAGYTERHVQEIILGLAQKVMSNYINHIGNTPVDAPFAKFDWTKK